jgi:hypothetical protein
MSRPWDINTNFTEKRIGRFGNSLMGANPPNMVRGALFRGPRSDSRLYTFGGSTFLANTSDPSWQPPSSDQYSLWSYDTSLMTWNQYDISRAVPRRPNWGAVTEAVSLGLGFVLNGILDRGSSHVLYTMTEYVGGTLTNATNDQIVYLGGMTIIDLSTQTVRNVSTETLGAPRVGGGFIHAPSFGKSSNGTLVTFGGMVGRDEGNNTFTNGIIVSCCSQTHSSSTNVCRPTSIPFHCVTHSRVSTLLGSIKLPPVMCHNRVLIFVFFRARNLQKTIQVTTCKSVT